MLALGLVSGEVALYRIGKNAPVRMISLAEWGYEPETTGSVSDIAWSPDDRALAVRLMAPPSLAPFNHGLRAVTQKQLVHELYLRTFVFSKGPASRMQRSSKLVLQSTSLTTPQICLPSHVVARMVLLGIIYWDWGAWAEETLSDTKIFSSRGTLPEAVDEVDIF